ncbi:transcription factor ATOH8 [Discoglossus pictus]
MKNLQVLEEQHWKPNCIKGIKKLKRRSRELIKNGVKSYKVDELPAQDREPQTSVPGAELRGADALDLSNGTAYMATSKKGLMRGSNLEEYEAQSYQPRIMMCQRPPETPYLSVSQVTYSPDPSASPRKRLETAGVSTEIKAIQQTRRLLANARERTRVHTISAAFEALRKQVPCYSYGQKLSKLAILRIACNYILSLAQLADLDYSADHSNLSFSECVEQCTRTLQSEGRSKKRKE